MRHTVLLALCLGLVAAGEQGTITVPVLRETNNTLWLSSLDTEVCLDLPEDVELKRLELVALDGAIAYATMDLPPTTNTTGGACVNFSAFVGASDITTVEPSYLLRAVDTVNHTTLASTEPFAVAAMVMSVGGDSSATQGVFTLIVEGRISQPGSAREGGAMRLVDAAGNAAGECPCATGTVRCSFDIPRHMGAPTRGPYRVLFYPDNGPTPVSVVEPYASTPAFWGALGL